MEKQNKSNFSGTLGFVLAAAGSAVGVGNIWRFPYLAAKDGGGLFLLVYLVLVLTFGFTLLSTDLAIGRRTQQHAMKAYSALHPNWGFLGKLTFVVPAIILPFYVVIGGWITKYFVMFLAGFGAETAQSGYFEGFITDPVSSVAFMLLFLALTAFVVFSGVEKGIESFSKVVMPALVLMIIGIALFSLTLSHTDESGVTRTGLQGAAIYLIPNFEGLTLKRFLEILLDAMSQLFFSMSVSMGIMITYGAYVKKDVNMNASVSQIEFFDTAVAFLAGLMIIPAVYVFFGTEGMLSGPKLMFVSLPKVFAAMGRVGGIVGTVFFLMVIVAALTSSVSIMETLVASSMEVAPAGRKKLCLTVGIVAAIGAVVVCLGYNVFYFELPLPNGATGQVLDVLDYISNSVLMPAISLLSCIFIGWVVGPKTVEEEMEISGHPFRRKRMYRVMIRFVAPVMMALLFAQSTGLLNIMG